MTLFSFYYCCCCSSFWLEAPSSSSVAFFILFGWKAKAATRRSPDHFAWSRDNLRLSLLLNWTVSQVDGAVVAASNTNHIGAGWYRQSGSSSNGKVFISVYSKMSGRDHKLE